ncbi:FkbM family methyltransferase [Salinibacter ruber]|uniref:FkbM family methyltransferase n=1 Tax=Salinibacter ruber TaxID=146919 RepID=UPI00216915DE|nr:FkbM family methyltransferase [Salinibacter ruber]
MLIQKMQEYAAKSRLITRVAVKVRNQCHAILSFHIGKDHNISSNGEKWFIKKHVSRNAQCVVDIGANRGGWVSTVCQSSSSRIEAFCYEPDPRVSSEFKSNTEKLSGVYLREIAVGEESGKIEIFLDRESTEKTSAVSGVSKDSIKKEVEITTLDEEFERIPTEYIDMLKIDVEGYEESVLRGANRLLSKGKIGCIQFEYGGAWAKASATLQGVVSFLRDHEYEVFLLQPNCLQAIDFELIGEYFGYSNYIAVKKSKIQELDEKNMISGTSEFL